MIADPHPFTYDSADRRSPATRELIELLRYRDLLRLMVTNIVKTRYKRSALGVVWTLLNPLLNMAVLTIAFSSLFRASLQRYPVYILAGLICWNLFAQTTISAMNTLVWGGSLLKRIYIPRTIFAVAAIGNGLVNLGLALIPLVVIMGEQVGLYGGDVITRAVQLNTFVITIPDCVRRDCPHPVRAGGRCGPRSFPHSARR